MLNGCAYILTVDDALTLRGLAELYHINQKPRRV